MFKKGKHTIDLVLKPVKVVSSKIEITKDFTEEELRFQTVASVLSDFMDSKNKDDLEFFMSAICTMHGEKIDLKAASEEEAREKVKLISQYVDIKIK